MSIRLFHPIALILLTEAHVAVPVPLCHAGVVHHEEVHIKAVCTCSLNLVVMSSYELNHLHTAPITWLGGGHVALEIISNKEYSSQQVLLTLGYVQFQGSWHLGSSQELQSKQSIVFPAENRK